MQDEKKVFEIVGRAIIKDSRGQILLVKRAKKPAKDMWALPGGKVKLGRSLMKLLKEK